MDSGTEVYGTLVSDIQTDVEVTGKPVYMSAIGNPVTVNVRKGNMKNGVITFEPIQSGSGTPSPENVRPIVPYNSLEVAVNGSITVIDIDGQKYGGELDLTTGVLKVKYGYLTFDGSEDENWNLNMSNIWYRFTIQVRDAYAVLGQRTPLICDKAEYARSGNYENIAFMYGPNQYVGTLYYIPEQTIQTVDDLRTFLASNNISICYQLKTEQIIQVHPIPIILDRGSNTITVNGNSTISFDYYSTLAGKISGTLYYIEDGLAPSGYLSGSGNFIALHLDSDDWSRYTSVKVGLDPSQASGMVEILQDEEKIVVGKITDNEQVFIVESTDGEFTKTDVYSLSDLVLETE